MSLGKSSNRLQQYGPIAPTDQITEFARAIKRSPAQVSYGFNYYGTIGTNRDEFVVIRKMNKVDWLEEPAGATSSAPSPGPRAAKY